MPLPNGNSYTFALFKKYLDDVLKKVIGREIFKVEVKNPGTPELQKSIGEVAGKIAKVGEEIKDLGKKDNQSEVVKTLREVNSSLVALGSDLGNLQDGLIQTYQGSFDKLNLGEDIKGLFQDGRVFRVDVQNQVSVENLSKSLEEIKRILSQVQRVTGEIKITNPQDKVLVTQLPKIKELDSLSSGLTDVKRAIEKIKFPQVKIPEAKSINEEWFVKILEALDGLRNEVAAIPVPEMSFPKSVEVSNFPPQKIPQPVTNININSLRGPLLATQVDVGTTATKVPLSSIANRRSLILFNNDTNETLYLGNENVNTSDGMPILPQQYSFPLDIGDKVSLYGIVGSGTIDVRIFEVSMEPFAGN